VTRIAEHEHFHERLRITWCLTTFRSQHPKKEGMQF